MAGNKEDQNPFSFKKFMTAKPENETNKSKTLEVVDDDDDDDDIFKVPDRRQEASKKLIISDNDGSSVKGKKKGKSENPFSFKKFLSGSSTKKGAGHSDNLPKTGEQNPVFDSIENSSLPDFVQDNFHTETFDSSLNIPTNSYDSSTNKGVTPETSDSLDLAFDLPITNSGRKDKGKVVTDLKSDDLIRHGKQPKRSESFSSSEDEASYSNKDTLGNILPDFLSEVSMGQTKTTQRSEGKGHRHGDSVKDNTDHDLLLTELREENARLKDQLNVVENERQFDLQKISDLEKQFAEQRRKEVEETSIMEKAMEQVEENLKDTTQRAVHAESTITKLKQEVKTLQGELKILREESVQGKSDQLSDVKERTSYVAEQLASATQTAESSLRQLLSGVDKLKVLSQVLDSIDKISDHKQTDDTTRESS